MDIKERASEAIRLLAVEYPYKGTWLNWYTPLELLVATILSAQATDIQINKITPALFERYKSAEDFVNTSLEELENYIRGSGFYHRKAVLIQAACKLIVEKYAGQVPQTMEELTTLPGVARKTANIVLANAFGVVEGIAVDTHVMRLAQRLGFTTHKNREKIERDLLNLIPKDKWYELNYLLIGHGKMICNAKKPNCTLCVLKKLCISAFNFPHNRSQG